MQSQSMGSASRWRAGRSRSARRAIGTSASSDDENDEIADWLVRLTATAKTGALACVFCICATCKGYGWNHKRVYRIYCELELNLRIKPKKRLKRDKAGDLAVPEGPNDTWSMDFMAGSAGGWSIDPDAERAG